MDYNVQAYTWDEYVSLISNRLVLVAYANVFMSSKPSDEFIDHDFQSMFYIFKREANDSGDLMAGHIFKIFSHVGLLPSWMQRYRPLPGKTNKNVKEIAKRWDLYPKSGDVSVPQLRSIFEAVRKGAEEALSKTLDDNDLEQAICKVAWLIRSNGKVLPYVSWLVKEQPKLN